MHFSNLRTWAEIDLDAVAGNFALAKSLVPAQTKLMAVIKADAYGHGAVPVAKVLEPSADFFAVAMLDEGIELRMAGIQTPILVLSYSPPELFPVFLKHRITPTVFTFENAVQLSECAKKENITAPLHLALDTGMSRIGFPDTEESALTIQKICNLPFLYVEGLFSHFAAADEKDKTHALMQKERFQAFTGLLAQKGVLIPLRHLYNSAATIEFETEYEMVREGIILYGLLPSLEINKEKIKGLRPAMALKTHIVHIHTLPAGTSVSYGHTYTTARQTRVATLCAGYADGVPRLLSNRGKVLIHEQAAPILGRVCMDQFMVDVTGIAEAAVGDDATVFGPPALCADMVAQTAQTIGYELVCGITKRVPRLYFQNGKCVGKHFGIPHEEM